MYRSKKDGVQWHSILHYKSPSLLRISSISLLEILFFSPLLKMVKRYTFSSITFTQEIILAPPDFPFFLEAMARRILYISLPRGVP
jgi:hypothetical protein